MALVVLMFLLHGRSALVPMLTLPLVVLLTFAAMRLFGVPATVMSLGGIAIALGMAVDADLVALEACHRRLEAERAAAPSGEPAAAPDRGGGLVRAGDPDLAGDRRAGVRPGVRVRRRDRAAAAPARAHQDPGDRRGGAGHADGGARAARSAAARDASCRSSRNPLTRLLVRAYRPFVHFALSRPAFTLATAGLAALSCLPIVAHLGSEFLPRIDEGDLFYMPTTAPGLSADDADGELTRAGPAHRRHPRCDAGVRQDRAAPRRATDPAPLSMAETTIRLKPRDEWPRVHPPRWYSRWAPAPLKRVLRRDLAGAGSRRRPPSWSSGWTGPRVSPGWTNAWTAPVRARIDMMSTGVRTPVGVRIVADDPARLDALGAAVRAAVRACPARRSAVYEGLGGETRLAVRAGSRQALARRARRSGATVARSDRRPRLRRRAASIGRSVAREPGDAARRRTPRRRSRDRARCRSTAPVAGTKPPEDLLRDATVRAGATATGSRSRWRCSGGRRSWRCPRSSAPSTASSSGTST